MVQMRKAIFSYSYSLEYVNIITIEKVFWIVFVDMDRTALMNMSHGFRN